MVWDTDSYIWVEVSSKFNMVWVKSKNVALVIKNWALNICIVYAILRLWKNLPVKLKKIAWIFKSGFHKLCSLVIVWTTPRGKPAGAMSLNSRVDRFSNEFGHHFFAMALYQALCSLSKILKTLRVTSGVIYLIKITSTKKTSHQFIKRN